MSEPAKPDRLASSVSEEVLRRIYGEDFKGCTIHPEVITKLIREALATDRKEAGDLIDLYEKVVEAVHLLSTPPETNSVNDPVELRNLLSQRLDAIHAITSRTLQTIARARQGPG